MKSPNGLSWDKNETSEPQGAGLAWSGPREQGREDEPDEAKNQKDPVTTFDEGYVKARIWQNGPDDAPDYKVDIIRTYSTPRGERKAKNLRPEDIRHALRALWQAKK